jgi:hypothetical protein
MYFVQAGAFRTTDDAEAQRAKLSLMGVEAKVTEREQAGRTVYRVRAGPFNKKDDADRLKDRSTAAAWSRRWCACSAEPRPPTRIALKLRAAAFAATIHRRSGAPVAGELPAARRLSLPYQLENPFNETS